MASIANLAIKIIADASGVSPGITQAEKRLAAFAKNSRNMSADIASGLKGVPAALTGLSLGGGLVGLAAGFKSSVDYLDEIGDKASGIGETGSNLSKLDYIATRMGSSAEAAEGGLSKMIRAIGDAQSQGGPAAKAIEALGLNVDALASMSPVDAMQAIAAATAQVESPFERAAIGADIFGKSVSDLMPLLSGGADAWEKFAQRGNKIGAIVSEEQITAAGTFADTLDDLGGFMRGLGGIAVEELAPDLSKLINTFAEADGAAGSMRLTMRALKEIGVGTAMAFESLKGSLGFFLSFADIAGLTASQTGHGAVNATALKRLGGNADIARRVNDLNSPRVGIGFTLMDEAKRNLDWLSRGMPEVEDGLDDVGTAAEGAGGSVARAAKRMAAAGNEMGTTADTVKGKYQGMAGGVSNAMDLLADDVTKAALAGDAAAKMLESQLGAIGRASERAAFRASQTPMTVAIAGIPGEVATAHAKALAGLDAFAEDFLGTKGKELSPNVKTALAGFFDDIAGRWKSFGDDLTASTRTPMEVLQDKLADIDMAYKLGSITAQVYGRATVQAWDEMRDAAARAGDVLSGDPGAMNPAMQSAMDYSMPAGGFVGGVMPDNFRYFTDPVTSAMNGGRQVITAEEFTASANIGYQRDEQLEEQIVLLRQLVANTSDMGMVA